MRIDEEDQEVQGHDQNELEQEQEETSSQNSTGSASSSEMFLGSRAENDRQIASTDEVMRNGLELEKDRFLKLIQPFTTGDRESIKRKCPKSTGEWWIKHQADLPLLYQKALVLYNIPASAAFNESTLNYFIWATKLYLFYAAFQIA